LLAEGTGARVSSTDDEDLPAFLQCFDRESLERDGASVAALDADGRIAWTNSAWKRFARDNGGDEVLRRFGPGASYFDAMSGDLRAFYERAFREAVATSRPFEQDYACPSATLDRNYHLRVLPLAGGGMLVEHSLVSERPHEGPSAEAHEAMFRDDDGILHQCSNCRRMRRVDGAWHWVPAWVVAAPPWTSHGLCGACVGFYWGAP
jgi:hypothetical protein